MTKQQQNATHNQNQSKKQSPNTNINPLVNKQQQPQNNDIQVSQNRPIIESKKKIIKKFPFKSTFNSNKSAQHIDGKGTDDGLKNWKPVSLQSSKKAINDSKKLNINKSVNFANSFLSFLPKPKVSNNEEINLKDLKQQRQMSMQKRKLIIDQKEQKNQWDAQDEFLKKHIPQQPQLLQKQKQSSIKQQSRFEYQQDENEVIQRIDWLNEKKPNKKQVSIADLVNKTWEKQQKGLLSVNERYSDSSSEEGNNKNIRNNIKNAKNNK